jgi:membrane peptidoglycan carboxypeptidase
VGQALIATEDSRFFQAPSAYDPIDHLSAGRLRQRHVLTRLVATNVLSPAQADAAFAASLSLR